MNTEMVGQEFFLAEAIELPRYDNERWTWRFPVGTSMRVTRVYSRRALVRGINAGGYESSAFIDLDVLVNLLDPNLPRPRRLGEVPEDGIDPNDPRLKWLWEDAAKLARDEGYCGTYDHLCAKLGIPGRPRNFTANLNVGKVRMTGKYLCHSREEALNLLKAELQEQGILIPESASASVSES